MADILYSSDTSQAKESATLSCGIASRLTLAKGIKKVIVRRTLLGFIEPYIWHKRNYF
jgi:hypothetical protein